MAIHNDLQVQGVIDSRCSRHMTGNMSYLTDYEEIDGEYVAFGKNPKGGEITGKGTIKTDHKVKVIRCDNGTEFKNGEMNQFCEMNGILRQFSIARTPQQNGVAKRRNMTLIEAARTIASMILNLPTSFGPEASLYCCYGQIKYHLGKFDGKVDEGFFVGYSLNSKAFRVFNSKTRIVEENLHIRFSESTPNCGRCGLDWLLDIDATNEEQWNYEPIVAGTQSNGFADTKASDNEDLKSFHDDGSKPSSDDGKKVDGDLRKDNEYKDQEKEDNVNNTNNVNAASTNEVNVVWWKNKHWNFHLSKICPAWKMYSLFDFSSDDEDMVQWKNLKRKKGLTMMKPLSLLPPVARIGAIRLFLAYASFKDFMVYQMDVKSAFLHVKIKEEVYVCQPPGFEDPDFPDKYTRLKKNCMDYIKLLELSMKPCQHICWTMGFKEGKFTRPYSSKGTKKFGFTKVKTASTLMETQKPLLKDEDGEEVDVHMYRSMIGSLMYLTSSRPDIMYLKGQLKLGLWYPKDSPFDLVAYTDSDYAGASLDRKSTTGGQAKKSVKLMIEKLFRMELKLMLVTQINAARHNLLLLSYYCWVKVTAVKESDRFEQIVDFLNAHPIMYALTVNPTIYISCIEQFWSTTMAKTINGEVQLHARVDGKEIVITESSVRRDLQLADEEGVDCLPNSTIFEQLALMGPKTTAWNEFSSTMASAIICLATNQKFNFSKLIFDSMIRNLDSVSGKGFSGRVTPLFPTMVAQNQSELGEGSAMPTDPHHTPTILQPSPQPQKTQKPRKTKRKDTHVPQPSDPSDNIAYEAVYKKLGDSLVRAATTVSSLEAEKDSDGGPRCQKTMGDTIAQTRVLDLEKTKTTQQIEIASLKRRVKKLKKKSRSRTHKLKRLYKVGLTARVESSDNEESLGEDASKQGRIDVIDADEEITLVSVAGNIVSTASDATTASAATTTTATTITVDDITLDQALEELKTTKPKNKGVVIQELGESTTTKSSQLSSQQSQDKGKGIMIEPVKPIKKKDQIMFDEETALKLQAEYDIEERLAREKAKKEQEANIALIEE
ncbi:putative ribonuclease H-like domain-containing protein [Tanacetum coccineum]